MKDKIIYWLTGSQTLYGDDVLQHVAQHSEEMANYVNRFMPVTVKYLTTCKSSDEIVEAVKKVNADENCVGIIAWCHTFSPAKMWINGLKLLQKPMCHFATQYNEKLPYDTIDMDFMNENQAAHGDREFGYIVARMRMDNKVIVGHYTDEAALKELASWCRVAAGLAFSKTVKVCRFSDNMRDVAVTEGDKIDAHENLGWQVDYYPIGDLVEYINAVTEKEVDALIKEYGKKYKMGTDKISVVREQAKYEIAIEKFCRDKGGYIGIVDHFGTLHGLNQLPGLAIQDLQSKGYGFGAEGDWKIAALGAVMQYMADQKGTGMMEDYTYDLKDGLCLGAHMLEVSPQFAATKPEIQVHPLGIGGKSDPARLVFEGIAAPEAIAVSMIDMGNRMRLIVQKIELVKYPHKMPNLPVGGLMWKYRPNFKDGVAAWIYAGGAHHTVVSAVVTAQEMIDLGNAWGVEVVVIDEKTELNAFKQQLMWADRIWKLKS
ncbi:MAG: L-arabinose isomerase [Clostridiales bacterium]|nr:L-arabinose isomerase [Clostridiales bacterium]